MVEFSPKCEQYPGGPTEQANSIFNRHEEIAANAGLNCVPFSDTHEELTTNLRVKFLDYAKLVLDPTTGETGVSFAMAIADVFSKNGYTIPNKNAKILKIFERLEMLKGRWVISWR